jgi:hypothetical protein
VSKNAEFYADFDSVEKVVKKCTKKSYKQNKFDKQETPFDFFKKKFLGHISTFFKL